MAAAFLNLPTLIHVLIGLYFAFFGFWNIYHWVPIVQTMMQKRLPVPYLLLAMGITWQIVAGCMIVLGFLVKLAAISLIPFTIIAVIIFHPFWQFKGEVLRLNFTIFVANFTIGLGALLSLIAPFNSVTDFLY